MTSTGTETPSVSISSTQPQRRHLQRRLALWRPAANTISTTCKSEPHFDLRQPRQLASISPTQSQTASESRSQTYSATLTQTVSVTPSSTQTSTLTPTSSPSQTLSPSVTSSSSQTLSPSPTHDLLPFFNAVFNCTSLCRNARVTSEQ